MNTNSKNTFDKTINCTFGLYTANKNDSVLVDFGDNSNQLFQLSSGKTIYSSGCFIIN